MRRGATVLAAALLLVGAVVPPARAGLSGPVRFLAGFTANMLDPGDDGSSAAIALPFTVRFYGQDYTTIYVNNNGNVSFAGPLPDFTPFPLANAAEPVVAPFFADVDTTNLPGSNGAGTVYFGTDVVDGHPAFAATWSAVGYYAFHTDKLNTFQVVLIGRDDVAAGAFDIEFNYDTIQWETGDADGGVGGLGGGSVRAGFSAGTGVAGTSQELVGSGVPGSFLDDDTATGLVHGSTPGAIPGRYVFPVPCRDDASCDDGSLCTTDACNPSSPDADGRGCTHDAVCPSEACRSCDPTTGTCGAVQADDGTPCDDGEVCTEGETCQAGACTPATVLADGTACDNGNDCSQRDQCAAGTCVDPPACGATTVTPDPAGKPVIVVGCGGDGPTAARGDSCAAQGFDAGDETSIVALVPIATAADDASGVKVTKRVRKKLGRRTGHVALRLRLNKRGRLLLRQRAALTPPRPLNVAVMVEVKTQNGTATLRRLISLLKH